MRVLPLLSLSFVLTACPGGLRGSGNDGSQCVAERSALDLDEVAPVGFTARQMVESVAGPQTETLVQHSDHPSSTITVEVIYNGGEVWFVDQVKRGWGLAKAADTADPHACNDHIEVEVEISLVSADGLINERYPTTITSGPYYYYASSVANFMLEDLNGSYTSEDDDLDAYDGVEVSFYLDFDHRGTRGWIYVQALEACDDGLCSAAVIGSAHWPER